MWHEGWSSFEITFSWPFTSLESDIPVSLNWEWTTWFERFLIFQDVVDRSILSPEDGKHQMDWINQGELEEGKRKRQFITLFVRNQCMARALLSFSLWRDFVTCGGVSALHWCNTWIRFCIKINAFLKIDQNLIWPLTCAQIDTRPHFWESLQHNNCTICFTQNFPFHIKSFSMSMLVLFGLWDAHFSHLSVSIHHWSFTEPRESVGLKYRCLFMTIYWNSKTGTNTSNLIWYILNPFLLFPLRQSATAQLGIHGGGLYSQFSFKENAIFSCSGSHSLKSLVVKVMKWARSR